MVIKVLQKLNLSHPKIVIILEGSEESGSFDFGSYLPLIDVQDIDIVVALDCFSLSYDRLWVTNSTRGILVCDLKVEVLTEGVHSGDASGIVPDSFRILRNFLNKFENSENGEILIKELAVQIPEERIREAEEVVDALGDSLINGYPWISGVEAVSKNKLELYLNRAWKA